MTEDSGNINDSNLMRNILDCSRKMFLSQSVPISWKHKKMIKLSDVVYNTDVLSEDIVINDFNYHQLLTKLCIAGKNLLHQLKERKYYKLIYEGFFAGQKVTAIYGTVHLPFIDTDGLIYAEGFDFKHNMIDGIVTISRTYYSPPPSNPHTP